MGTKEVSNSFNMLKEGYMKNIFIRWGLWGLLFFVLSVNVSGQTFILKPAALANKDGDFETKLFLKKDQVFRVSWTSLDGTDLNLTGKDAKLIIGRSSNNYNVLEVNTTSTKGDFIPSSIGLGAGRYYARVTNSNGRTTTDIQDDQQTNPSSIIYSNEILLLIEATEAPAIISPRGKTSNPTPTFQWTSVSGVPSYWIIVSSSPFDIVEDKDGNISIEGATIVWQYITKNNTAEYGAVNKESPFKDEAPPLNANQEYSFTILNVYEDNNPVYTSPVFGGIVPFIFSDPNALPKTTLNEPINDEVFFSEKTITFSWKKIPESSNYTINLLQVVKQQGVDVTIPIWKSTTTNNSIDYPAIENLKNGRFKWNVVTNNSTGGGTTSNSNLFTYKVETGEFNARIQSSTDNSSLVGVELTATAISGGVTPSVAYAIQNESYSDSLVAGIYEFKAVKTGFENVSTQIRIRDARRSNFTLKMNPLPSSIQGSVKDNNGSNVANATVNITNLSSGEIKNAISDVNGGFSASLKKGSYSIQVSKTGYISSTTRSITLGLNVQKEETNPFIIKNDQATITGVINNEDGLPVQQANVTIKNGSKTFETKTNGSGLYQFIVSSGKWTLSIQKIGFVKPKDKIITLSTGDVLQNQNFILTGNANQVTGFIRERITNNNGLIGVAPFEGITVEAIPNVGSVITTVSEKNGQYTLSLKSGSYTIKAKRQNYTSNQDRELVIGIAIGETISNMDFELIPNPSSISGTVTLSNGNGVADVQVTVPNVGTTTTTNSGYYKISVPSGSHNVLVSKSGLVSPDPKSITVKTGQSLNGLNFIMIPNAGSISGQVSSGGEALLNTSLTAINTSNGKKVQIVNNLDGTFSFNLQSGNWYIKAVKAGFLMDSTSIITIGPGQKLVDQNFSLIKNLTTVRGTITDGINPLKNASILVTNIFGEAFNQTTISQVNGTYAFSIPAGASYQIRTSKDGYKTLLQTTDQLVPEQTVIRNFTLTANPSSVAGKVFVSTKSVLSNAKVVAINNNGVRVDSTTTRTDGSYLLGLSPGSYTLSITKAGYTTSIKSTSLSIGQNLTGIDFTVNENFAVFSGKITDSEGNILDQVFINISREGGGGASAVTDQEGAFTLSGLTEGRYSVQITKAGFIDRRLSRVVMDGDFVILDQVLTPKNGVIEGQILDENGAFISSATVIAVNENGEEYTAVTNTSGAYSFNSLELGEYTINASKTGYTSNNTVSAELTEGNLIRTSINLSDLIPNNVVISGIVTNSSSSSFIKDAQVSITGSGGSGFALSNSEGAFSVSNLSAGTYSVKSSKDGFKTSSSEITVVSGGTSGIINFFLVPNNGKITGVIRDVNNEPLPFKVTVNAVSETKSLITQADLTGKFTFEGIETGLDYKISTDIYRDGYENVETLIEVPPGSSTTILEDDLKVITKKSSISGNTEIGEVTLSLLNANNNEVIDLTSSDLDGNFSFNFLGQGSYKVIPKKFGYLFTPTVSNTIDLDSETSSSVSFAAQANIATLEVIVNNSSGSRVPNVEVTIISADTTIILSEKTNSTGIAKFRNIKATNYLVRPAKQGFSINPESINVTLNSRDSVSSTFIITANSSALTGNVKSVVGGNTSNLNATTITAILDTTGQSFETVTNNSGVYSFNGLPGGTYSVIASKSGFISDTISVMVNIGDSIVAEEIILNKSSVDLRGTVRLKGIGVEGVQVTALSANTLNTTTNTSGSFRFASLPVKTGVSDTTVYQIKVTEGIFSKSYLVSITPNQVGSRINLPVTNLPSGKIELLVTDGVEPIPGAKITFGISGGESSSDITGNDGLFESSENLRKALYTVSASKEGLLYPQNTIRVELPTDTTVLTRAVYLPYTQLEVEEILADQETQVDVVNQVGYDNSSASGILFYKRESESIFTQTPMSRIGDTLRANIPAFGSVEEITFYTSIDDENRNNNYLSLESDIIPLASGILSDIRVTPTISGQKLRAGDSYKLDLFVRDGINKSLRERFEGETPEGSIEWLVVGEEGGVLLSNQKETSITLEAISEGTYQVQVSVNLDGTILNRSLTVDITNTPLESISVGIPSKKVSNTSEILFSYSAVDTSGGSVVLGEALSWSVIPPTSGTIDERGVFEALNSSTIGSFKIVVSDAVSKIRGVSEVVELVARIEPDEAYSFTDGNGLQFLVSEGSVDIPSQLSLGETTPPSTKKFVFGQGTDVSYTVSDKIYVLTFNGSDLKKAAELILPEDSSLALNEGSKKIGRFNYTTLQWEILSNTTKTVSQRAPDAVIIEKLGQFAILAENEPLGIKYGAVLPSPFSPDIAPVKIGYWLNTAFPPAKVNIHIYNIRGELVRTILEDDLQQPGRYGSSSSTKEITWDGLTDNGKMARNGRYVIQIKAKDQQDEVVKLLQVVLIK
tara:strand:- start:25133 stop:32332 length:7200 start_codon:yes stop_codon:yes gene_type:complete